MFEFDSSLAESLPEAPAEPAGADSPSSRPVVVVAHRCPLLRTGLVHTLSGVPGLEVRVVEHDALIARAGELVPCSIVVADLEAAWLVWERQRASIAGAPVSSVGVVVVAAAKPRRHLDRDGSGPTVWLPLHCREEDLVQAMAKLSPVAPDTGWPAPRAQPTGGLAPGAARRVRDVVEKRLADRITLDELAEVAGLSVCHFSRAFKQTVGVAPHRYLMLRRTERAAQLIRETRKPLTDIGLEVGFADQSHFTRMFSRLLGLTPSAYRQKHR